MSSAPTDFDFSEDEEDWGPEIDLPADDAADVPPAGPLDPDLFQSMARLVVGGAAEGGSIFLERLKTWEMRVQRLGPAVYREAPDESQGERLRYAAVGFAELGLGVAEIALRSAASASEAAYGLVANLARPISGSRVMRPVVRRYDSLAARGEETLERLIDTGRAAEQRSRALVRQAYDDGSTEVIQVAVGKLSDEPSVRDLVTAQGTSMAGVVVDALRNAGASADARAVRVFQRGSAASMPVPVVVIVPAAGGTGPLTFQSYPAGFVSRLVALVTDVAIVTVASVILGAVISLILNFFGLGAQQLQAGSQSQILHLIRNLTVALSALAVVLFVPLYFVTFWRLGGATPGKMLMGLRVVHGDDPNITPLRGILRYLGYFLSALPLFLGFFWVLGDSRRQGWHDKLAKTRVVHVSEISPNA